jgi:putative membrane protein
VTHTSSDQRPYRRLSPLTPLVRSFIFFVAVASASWRDALNGSLGPLGWILLALLVAGVVYGTASWLRTKYWIEGDELRVDTGVISRQSRRIRVDRLQGIDIVQPLAARVFGLAELKMDVAGGHRREGSLAFLPLQEARDLREMLLARRDQVREARLVAASPPPAGPDAPGAPVAPGAPPIPLAPAVPVAPEPEQKLLGLDHTMLLVSLLISGETFGFLLSAAVFALLFTVAGGLAGATSMIPVVGGFALLQGRKFAAFYNYSATRSSAGLQVRRGLFELSSQTITLARVQGVVVVEPLLWRRLGWARLDVSIAGYGKSSEGNRPAASTILPVARRSEVMWFASYVLQGLHPDQVTMTPPPQRSRWVAPIWRRRMAAGVGGGMIASRSGVVTRRTQVVPHARVQSLRLSQGPWQRLFRLADLHVDSPPGPVSVRARHRDVDEARGLLDEESRTARTARRALR